MDAEAVLKVADELIGYVGDPDISREWLLNSIAERLRSAARGGGEAVCYEWRFRGSSMWSIATKSDWIDREKTPNIEVRALYAAPPAPAIPEGWRLVPIEPTEEMDSAARAECHRMQGVIDPVIHIWDVMLAAAPSPEVAR